ncbi:hypothetical protein ILS93_03415 [Bacillus sp. 16GRE42]|uniref:hypothetical protein n=1 Tax=Bacillus sp. 16GRE42 TaxID=2778092 RepID=UPI001C9B52A3|nr:hypothetical protein [Bacillus sp. 16GRE42]MBY7121162.1 hypothetical protein [Bacillus sp. 16GRE42]
MKLGSKIAAGIFTLSLAIGSFAPSSFASTTEVKKEEQIKSIKESYGDTKVQKSLIEKVNNGETLDNVNPEKKSLGKKERISETATLTTFPDGSKEETGIDYSEAKFFDEKGNEVQPSKVQPIKGIKGPQGSITGGTWTSGSGYSCVKGAKVWRQSYGNFNVQYYVDYCNHNGAYDKLDRVWGRTLSNVHGSYSIEKEGVFRTWEQSGGYAAYGGVKFAYTDENGRSSTQYLYVHVGNDRAWEDANF